MEKYDDTQEGLKKAKEMALQHRMKIYKDKFNFKDKKVKNTNPDNVERHLKLALYFFDENQHENAMEELEEIFGTDACVELASTSDERICPKCRNKSMSFTSIIVCGMNLPFGICYCNNCKQMHYIDDFIEAFRGFIKEESKWNNRADDIRGAVISYCLSKQENKVDGYYLSFGGKEPDDDFIKRFQGNIPIRRRSQGSVDVQNTMLINVEITNWLSANEVDASIYYTTDFEVPSLGGWGEQFIVSYEFGQWAVTKNLGVFHVD